MKNLITPFSVINFKKSINKNIKDVPLINREILVHHRRDLDSLG